MRKQKIPKPKEMQWNRSKRLNVCSPLINWMDSPHEHLREKAIKTLTLTGGVIARKKGGSGKAIQARMNM